MFGVVWITCCGGAQIEILTRMLGFGDFALGVLAAIPYLATFSRLPATLLIERTGLTKYQFIRFATVHRALWLVIALVPLMLPIPSTAAVAMTALLMLVSRCTDAMAAPAWLTWMGSLIPPRIRGRYWARRQEWTIPVQIVLAVIIGVIINALYDPDMRLEEYAPPRLLWAIVGILAVGGIFGIVDILMFHGIREVLPSRPARTATGHMTDLARARAATSWAKRWAVIEHLLFRPLRDREFRGYVLYSACMTFALASGSWFFYRNMRENLKLSPLTINCLFMVIGPLAGMVSARVVGRAIDRWGRRPILVIATIGTLFSVAPWFFVTADTPGKVLICCLPSLIGGAAWMAITMAQTNIMLRFADGDGQSRYVAAFGFYVDIGGIMGGLAGGTAAAALGFLQTHPIILGPFLWNNWHVAFALSLAARATALFLLRGMHDPGAAPVRLVARRLRINVYNTLAAGLFYPLRLFGWPRPGQNSSSDAPDGNEPGC